MSFKGRIPRPENELARPRHRQGSHVQPTTLGQRLPATIPDPDPDWHPIARMTWDSFGESGQVEFWQSSDWAFAYSLMDDLSAYKRAARRSSEMLKAINTGLQYLLVSEGDRRRAGITLRHPQTESEPVAALAIADYKAALGVNEEGLDTV